MRRRTVLQTLAGGGLFTLAGCSSDGSPEQAPTSTHKGTPSATPTAIAATATLTPSPTATPTATPTPSPTPTPTPEIPDSSIQTDAAPFRGRASHFLSYGFTNAQVRVLPRDVPPDIGETAKLLVAMYEHPLRSLVTYDLSDSIDLPLTAPRTIETSVTPSRIPDDGYYYYVAGLVPGDTSAENISDDEGVKLGETNRFTTDGGEISPDPHPKSLEAVQTKTFDRTTAEGAYLLSFNGSTLGRNWAADYFIYRSVYLQRALAPRGRSRGSYVTIAQQQGVADTLGDIFESIVERNGFTEKREKVAFLVDFVQNLPYVPDDVSKGYDDYTKFVGETIAEGSGDCEDTAILMAALLQSQSFKYDCVLILLPGHMATGVYGRDLPGTYYTFEDRDYCYLETTGEGWDIGEIPDMYRNVRARLTQV